MVFIETSIFTRLVLALLHDNEYRELQMMYPKSVKDNLTGKETALLRDLVKEL